MICELNIYTIQNNSKNYTGVDLCRPILGKVNKKTRQTLNTKIPRN